jgi:hypothetical protein
METEDTTTYMYEVIKVTLPPAYSSSTSTAISTTAMYRDININIVNFHIGSCFSIIQNRTGSARMHRYQIISHE